MSPQILLALVVWVVLVKGPYYVGTALYWHHIVRPIWRYIGREFRRLSRRAPDHWKRRMIRWGYNPYRPNSDDHLD